MNNLLQQLTNIVRTKIHGEGYEPKLEVCSIVKFEQEDNDTPRFGIVTEFKREGFYISYDSYFTKSFRFDGTLGEYKVLGKPLTLREILLALVDYGAAIQPKSFIHDFDCVEFEYVTYSDTKEDVHYFVRVPLDKEPKDYPPETITNLIDLLK